MLDAVKTFTRRATNKWRRTLIEHYGRRDFDLRPPVPYVSFTFDDFPRTALTEGGRLLKEHGARGTYFVSLNLLGRGSDSGPIASAEDLRSLHADGHELGCHTFEHLDGWKSSPAAFEKSIAANHAALGRYFPGEDFEVFAYPLNGPVLGVKRAVARHFAGCRFGGQTLNTGKVDLNLLKAYFLDRRSGASLDSVRRIIYQNVAERGWLIFATHDVAPSPSEYGCSPEFFGEVVRLAVESGARVLPMSHVLRELNVDGV